MKLLDLANFCDNQVEGRGPLKTCPRTLFIGTFRIHLCFICEATRPTRFLFPIKNVHDSSRQFTTIIFVFYLRNYASYVILSSMENVPYIQTREITTLSLRHIKLSDLIVRRPCQVVDTSKGH